LPYPTLRRGLHTAGAAWLNEIWVFAVETSNDELRQKVEGEWRARGITRLRPMAEIERDLAQIARLLEGVRGDLHRAPDHKINTRWWDDRCRARQLLLKQRDELLEEQRQLVAVN
jgi:hypothetical protein